jgi:hypothetical protein
MTKLCVLRSDCGRFQRSTEDMPISYLSRNFVLRNVYEFFYTLCIKFGIRICQSIHQKGYEALHPPFDSRRGRGYLFPQRLWDSLSFGDAFPRGKATKLTAYLHLTWMSWSNASAYPYVFMACSLIRKQGKYYILLLL